MVNKKQESKAKTEKSTVLESQYFDSKGMQFRYNMYGIYIYICKRFSINIVIILCCHLLSLLICVIKVFIFLHRHALYCL
jgi:hypothetical protein